MEESNWSDGNSRKWESDYYHCNYPFAPQMNVGDASSFGGQRRFEGPVAGDAAYGNECPGANTAGH